MRTIKIVGRNHISLCLIKAVRYKKNTQLITNVSYGNKELTAGFTKFYQELLTMVQITPISSHLELIREGCHMTKLQIKRSEKICTRLDVKFA